MPYGDYASSEAPWWGNYYQPGWQYQQPSMPVTNRMLGLPDRPYMGMPGSMMSPRDRPSGPPPPSQISQMQQSPYYDSGQNANVQATPMPYYDSGQNANAQMQQLPYVQPQPQSTDPVEAWMRRYQQQQQQPKRNQQRTPAQQMGQRGLEMMAPSFAMPYGLSIGGPWSR